jgi:hypothetical protein
MFRVKNFLPDHFPFPVLQQLDQRVLHAAARTIGSWFCQKRWLGSRLAPMFLPAASRSRSNQRRLFMQKLDQCETFSLPYASLPFA